jgi:hypothetical protein
LSTLPKDFVVTQRQVKTDAFQPTQQASKLGKHRVDVRSKKMPTHWLPWGILGGGLTTVGLVVAVYHHKAEGNWGAIIPTMQEDLTKLFTKTKQPAEEAVKIDEVALPSTVIVMPDVEVTNVVDSPPSAPAVPAPTEKPRNSRTFRQRIGAGLATFALAMPSVSIPTIGADYAFNQSRIRQCVVEGTEQLLKPPVRSVEVVPTVGSKTKPQLVKNSSQLLPPLKYTNKTFETYDSASLKAYKLIDLKGNTIEKELYKANAVSDKYFDKPMTSIRTFIPLETLKEFQGLIVFRCLKRGLISI